MGHFVKNYYIQRNHASQMPWQVIALDCETMDDGQGNSKYSTQVLQTGCFVYRRYRKDRKGVMYSTEKIHHFDSVETLAELLRPIVTQSNQKTYLYAHNADFDFAILDLEKLAELLGMTTTFYVNEKPPTIILMEKDTAKLCCLDSRNIFQTSLADMALQLGLPPKGELPAETDLAGRQAHCEADALLLSRALDKWRSFLLEHDMGGYKYTVSGQAMAVFRHKYMPGKTMRRTHNEYIRKQERSAYYGGRVECFHLGKLPEPVYLLDVQSMYPYVMSRNTFPVDSESVGRDMDPREYKPYDGDEVGMVELSCTPVKPILPFRRGGSLTFPLHRVTGVWPWPEVQAALPYLRDVEWIAFWTYRHAPVFKDWAIDLYERRMRFHQDGEYAFAHCVKILMNSLYGKFGQRRIEWKDWYETDDPHGFKSVHMDDGSDELVDIRCVFGMMQRKTRDEDHRHAIPILAATITAYARLYLWELIETAGRRNVYYCNTDSLLVNEKGRVRLSHLVEPWSLGALSEEWGPSECFVDGPNHYRWDGGVKHGGRSSDARRIGPTEWAVRHFCGWEHMSVQGKRGQVDVMDRVWKRIGSYTKGNVHPNGRVTPFTA